MRKENLSVTLMQYDITWENVSANLSFLSAELSKLAGKTDLVILPEMFSTGFSMNPERFAEEMKGSTIAWLQQMAAEHRFAIAGSLMVKADGKYFNRAVFVQPDGVVFHYDKRHLFRMGDEPLHYHAGDSRPIISYLGWNICLLVCYDLRFPVWARNRQNEYDVLIYVANWPEARARVWDTLLKARAIENMAYVCGVNRVGRDGLNLNYSGGSLALNPRGDELLALHSGAETATTALNYNDLAHLRDKFPVWKDADDFRIIF